MRFVGLVMSSLFCAGMAFGGLSQNAQSSRIFLKWSRVDYQMKTAATPEQIRIIESSLRKWTGVPVRRVLKDGNLQIAIKRCPSQGVTQFRGSRPTLIIVDPNPEDGFKMVMDHEAHHLVHPIFHPG